MVLQAGTVVRLLKTVRKWLSGNKSPFENRLNKPATLFYKKNSCF